MNNYELQTSKERLIKQISEGNLTSEDIMILILERQKQTNEDVEMLKRDVNDIKESTPIHASLNNHLAKLRRKRVIEMMGGGNSKSYRHRFPEGGRYATMSGKVFAEAGRDFNSHFGIGFYGELPHNKYEEAKKYWANWEPSTNTKLEIRNINNQLELLDDVK